MANGWRDKVERWWRSAAFIILVLELARTQIKLAQLLDEETPFRPEGAALAVGPDRRYPGVAMVVEPVRRCPGIASAVVNILGVLPQAWVVQIFFSSNNEGYYQDHKLLQRLRDDGRVFFTKLDWSIQNYGLAIDGPKDPRNVYNRILTSQQLWLKVMAQKILFFQPDTRLCSNSARRIEDFIHLDYVGAPWPQKDVADIPEIDGRSLEVGNGALSMRSRSAMLTVTSVEHFEEIKKAYRLALQSKVAKLAEQATSEEHREEIEKAYPLESHTSAGGLPQAKEVGPSDIFFSFALRWLNKEYPNRYHFQIASADVAATFSVERPDIKWADIHGGDVFGIHQAPHGWAEFEREGMESFKKLCPDALPIFQRCTCGDCNFSHVE